MPPVLWVSGKNDVPHMVLLGVLIKRTDTCKQFHAEHLDFALGHQLVKGDPVSGTLVLAGCLGVGTVGALLSQVVDAVLVVRTEHPAPNHKVGKLFLVGNHGAVFDGQRRAELDGDTSVQTHEQVGVELHRDLLQRRRSTIVERAGCWRLLQKGV